MNSPRKAIRTLTETNYITKIIAWKVWMRKFRLLVRMRALCTFFYTHMCVRLFICIIIYLSILYIRTFVPFYNGLMFLDSRLSLSVFRSFDYYLSCNLITLSICVPFLLNLTMILKSIMPIVAWPECLLYSAWQVVIIVNLSFSAYVNYL